MYRRREEREEIRDVEPVDDVVEGDQSRYFEHSLEFRWSPAQFLAWLFGVLFLVYGAVALARIAADGGAHVSVGGLHHTAWLAIIHMIFGAFMLMAGAVPDGVRGLLSFMGTLALTFGLVVAIEPEALHEPFGVHMSHGVLYIVVGLASLAVAILSPLITGGERSYSRTRHTHLHR
jgi:hypothetical protein